MNDQGDSEYPKVPKNGDREKKIERSETKNNIPDLISFKQLPDDDISEISTSDGGYDWELDFPEFDSRSFNSKNKFEYKEVPLGNNDEQSEFSELSQFSDPSFNNKDIPVQEREPSLNDLTEAQNYQQKKAEGVLKASEKNKKKEKSKKPKF